MCPEWGFQSTELQPLIRLFGNQLGKLFTINKTQSATIRLPENNAEEKKQYHGIVCNLRNQFVP